MAPDEYNELDAKRKRDVAWFLWETYVLLDAPKYHESFHFLIYGSNRLLVNAKNIHRRDQRLFEADILQRLETSSVPNTKEKLFPIEALRRPFENANNVIINKEIPRQRFHWLDFDVVQHQEVEIQRNVDYGTCSYWGIPCCFQEGQGVYEIPLQYVLPKE